MYPHERSLVKQMEDRPFALIGVNSDRDREKILKTCEEKNLSWRSFWNGGSTGGPISRAWNVSGWPTIYIIDHKGIIRARGTVARNPGTLIEELVAEAERDKPQGAAK